MTRQEAIQHACETVSLAYISIGDFSEPSDCFCDNSRDYQNEGKALAYVRKAVLAQLKTDGFTIAYEFDPETGAPR